MKNGLIWLGLGLGAWWLWQNKASTQSDLVTMSQVTAQLKEWVRSLPLSNLDRLEYSKIILSEMLPDERVTLWRYMVIKDRSSDVVEKMNAIKSAYPLFV